MTLFNKNLQKKYDEISIDNLSLFLIKKRLLLNVQCINEYLMSKGFNYIIKSLNGYYFIVDRDNRLIIKQGYPLRALLDFLSEKRNIAKN